MKNPILKLSIAERSGGPGLRRLNNHRGGASPSCARLPVPTSAAPTFAGGAFGFADMGPWPGGQAEYLRVPWAGFMCLKLPPDAEQKQAAYGMCADIFPTGWHATELAGLKPGDAVVIYGSGPVGLMAAQSAMIKGACSVMVAMDWGMCWFKGQRIATGQCNVKA